MLANRRIFVTGTDTGVGKTLVSAALVLANQAHYWKPVQSGYPADTDTVQNLTQLPADHYYSPRYFFRAPLSPNQAATREKRSVRISALKLPSLEVGSVQVIEGAGGVSVPLNARTTWLDVLTRWQIPVLVVARGTLGTINHTLLTLEALRAREIPIRGIAFSGVLNVDNQKDIESFGRVPVLFHIPPFKEISPKQLQRWVAKHQQVLQSVFT